MMARKTASVTLSARRLVQHFKAMTPARPLSAFEQVQPDQAGNVLQILIKRLAGSAWH
jgi:hypothetical protein